MKDRTAVNHKIRKHFNELIYNVARYTEVVLSIVILVVIALAGLRLILTTAGTSVMDMDTSFFTSFLSQALSLVVGVEFVKCSAAIPPRPLLKSCFLRQQGRWLWNISIRRRH